MADRYWVGGANTWNTTAGTKWASTSGGAGGQAVPTTSDDVFFDANSGAVAVSSLGSLNAKSINFTGFTGTFSGTGIMTLAGSLTLVPGMTYTHSGAWTITANCTFTSGGQTIRGNVNAQTASVTVTFADDFVGLGTLTFTNGTLDAATNNVAMTMQSFASSVTTARTINMGSGTWTVTGGNWSVNTSNLTLNEGTSTLVFNAPIPSLGVATFSPGNTTYNNITFTGAAATNGTIRWADSPSCNVLTLVGPLHLSTAPSTTKTCTSITVNSSAAAPIILHSDDATSATKTTISVSAGTVALDYCAISSMAFAGGATFTAANSFDVYGNTGVTFTGFTGGGSTVGMPTSRVQLGM